MQEDSVEQRAHLPSHQGKTIKNESNTRRFNKCREIYQIC